MNASRYEYNEWTERTFFPVAKVHLDKVVNHLLAKKMTVKTYPLSPNTSGVEVTAPIEEVIAALKDLDFGRVGCWQFGPWWAGS